MMDAPELLRQALETREKPPDAVASNALKEQQSDIRASNADRRQEHERQASATEQKRLRDIEQELSASSQLLPRERLALIARFEPQFLRLGKSLADSVNAKGPYSPVVEDLVKEVHLKLRSIARMDSDAATALLDSVNDVLTQTRYGLTTDSDLRTLTLDRRPRVPRPKKSVGVARFLGQLLAVAGYYVARAFMRS